MNGHILPSSNAQYDLGSAEYKIRHLFLSDNSLWVGDSHKISIRGGQMKLRKRNINVVPKNLRTNDKWLATSGLDHARGLVSRTVTNEEDFTLHDWQEVARGLGMSREEVDDLFDADEDFEDENDSVPISSITGLQSALNEKTRNKYSQYRKVRSNYLYSDCF